MVTSMVIHFIPSDGGILLLWTGNLILENKITGEQD